MTKKSFVVNTSASKIFRSKSVLKDQEQATHRCPLPSMIGTTDAKELLKIVKKMPLVSISIREEVA